MSRRQRETTLTQGVGSKLDSTAMTESRSSINERGGAWLNRSRAISVISCTQSGGGALREIVFVCSRKKRAEITDWDQVRSESSGARNRKTSGFWSSTGAKASSASRTRAGKFHTPPGNSPKTKAAAADLVHFQLLFGCLR